MVSLETAEILARASPLNPRDTMLSRSVMPLILLVACLRKAVSASSKEMPQPSSVTRIYDLPPPRISTIMDPAPASIEFSTSSFTADTGLSITSPAAILSATKLSSTFIISVVEFLDDLLQLYKSRNRCHRIYIYFTYL